MKQIRKINVIRMFILIFTCLRNWEHAKIYIRGTQLVIQIKYPDDFLLITGETYKVKKFLKKLFFLLSVEIFCKEKAIKETGLNKKDENTIIKIKSKFFRPTVCDLLLVDADKAKEKLGLFLRDCFSLLVKKITKYEPCGV